MPLVNGFTIFGLIFLCINLFVIKRMKKEPTNPNCQEEINDIRTNFFWAKVLPPIDIAIILVGIIWWLVTGGPIID